MTTVVIDIRGQTSQTHPNDRVILYAPAVRTRIGGGLVSTTPLEVPLTQGQAVVENFEPGPVNVRFECLGIADTVEKRGIVPDSGVATLEDVIELKYTWTPPVVDAATKMLLDIVNAGLRDVTDANSLDRVAALEAIAGLTSQSPVDGQTASLVSQPETLTHDAVKSVSVAAIATTSMSQKIDFLLAKQEPTVFTLPEDFDFPVDMELSRDAAGVYHTDLDVAALHTRGDGPTLYVDPQSGKDLNTATGSRSDPYKTFAYLLAYNPTVSEVVFISSTVMPRSEWSYIVAPGRSVRAEPGVDITVVTGDRLVWSDAGLGRWSAPLANCSGVIDLRGYPSSQPRVFESRDTLAEVAGEPGTYHFSSGTLTIQMADGRAPDADVYALRPVNSLSYPMDRSMPAGSSIYYEGISFIGGTTANLSASAEGLRFYAKDCDFSYATSANGLTIRGVKETILQNCTASNNAFDGFNYHAYYEFIGGHVVEINCVGSNNGVGGGSNNGSSAHEDYRVVRIGGRYDGNQGANIADVNDAMSVNIGCRAEGSTDYRQDFYVNERGRMWLEECVAESETGFFSAHDAPLAIRASYTTGAQAGRITTW